MRHFFSFSCNVLIQGLGTMISNKLQPIIWIVVAACLNAITEIVSKKRFYDHSTNLYLVRTLIKVYFFFYICTPYSD